MNNDNFNWDNLDSFDATDTPQARPVGTLRQVPPIQIVPPATPQPPQAVPNGQFEIIDLDGPRTAIRDNTWGEVTV